MPSRHNNHGYGRPQRRNREQEESDQMLALKNHYGKPGIPQSRRQPQHPQQRHATPQRQATPQRLINNHQYVGSQQYQGNVQEYRPRHDDMPQRMHQHHEQRHAKPQMNYQQHPQASGQMYQNGRLERIQAAPRRRQQHSQKDGEVYNEQRQGTPQRRYQPQLRTDIPQNYNNGHQFAARKGSEQQLASKHQMDVTEMYDDGHPGTSQREYQQQHSSLQHQYAPETSQRGHLNAAQLREEQYKIDLMKERENEILDINKKMHTVNDIYKDLAEMIEGQQDLIDQLDQTLDEANANVRAGVENYDEARLRVENPIMEDPFGEKIQKRDPNRDGRKSAKDRRRSRKSDRGVAEDVFDCNIPFQTVVKDMKSDLKDVVQDMKSFVLSCTAPDVHENEYAFR